MRRTKQKPVATAATNMDHYVVDLARSVAKRGSTERYVFDSKGEAMIERALLDFADDPTLPRAVLGLFALAQSLIDEEESPSAAKSILDVLAMVGPELRALKRNHEDKEDARRRSYNQLVDRKASPVALNAPAPAGAIKVSELSEYGSVTRRRVRC
jgi:hypothetical protein